MCTAITVALWNCTLTHQYVKPDANTSMLTLQSHHPQMILLPLTLYLIYSSKHCRDISSSIKVIDRPNYWISIPKDHSLNNYMKIERLGRFVGVSVWLYLNIYGLFVQVYMLMHAFASTQFAAMRQVSLLFPHHVSAFPFISQALRHSKDHWSRCIGNHTNLPSPQYLMSWAN